MNTRLALAALLANIPVLLAVVVMSREPSAEENYRLVNKYAVAYHQAADKEEFLAKAYNAIKHVDENRLPPELASFLIKVKFSQFAK